MQDTALDLTIEETGEVIDLTAPPRRIPHRVRSFLAFLAVLASMAVLWELYKVVGKATGGTIPFTGIGLPVRPDDTSMPHLWDIAAALFRPPRRGGDDLLIVLLIQSAWFTFREAFVGFLVGSLIGFTLGVVFTRSSLVERGLMPWVIASQTIPMLAIAPVIVIWGGEQGWPAWISVSLIAAYLSFFPVTINTLRGLRSPHPTALDLMHSYAASGSEILWKIRFPAALPYIFTALKIAATASVIGAIIGELPSGLSDGLGRRLLDFSYTYITGPEKLFASVLVSALAGMAFVALVAMLERVVLPPSRRLQE